MATQKTYKSRRLADSTGEAGKREIVSAYLDGYSADAVALRFNVSPAFVRRLVYRSGQVMRGRNDWKRITPARAKEIADAYREGMTLHECGARFGCSTDLVYSSLALCNETPRTVSEVRRIYAVDETVFDTVTPESAYWVGMMMSDGCVINAGKTIALSLKALDIEHVQSFRRFLRAEHPLCHSTNVIRDNRYAQVSIRVTSERLVSALATFGVIPRKSYTARVARLENDRNFWRGVIDGDGSVILTAAGEARLNLVGSRHLLTQWLAFVQGITGRTPRIHPKHKVYKVDVHCRQAIKVMRTLYDNAPVALSRKAAKATEIIRLYSSRPARPVLRGSAEG